MSVSGRNLSAQATNASRHYRIALAGNPNTGKTSLFNALTGLRYKVANYPGVTVEKKSGPFQLNDLGQVELLDIPGIYNLNGTSFDEQIAVKALLGELDHEGPAELVVCVIDASNLERNLFLCSQLIELGYPVIVALNMLDLAEGRGISIKKEILARELGVPVCGLIANKAEGLSELKTEVSKTLSSMPPAAKRFSVPETFDFEENISARYARIREIIKKSVVYKGEPGLAHILGQKFDDISTHKAWGFVVFAAIIWLIFQSIFMWSALPMQLIDDSLASFSNWLEPQLTPGLLKSLILDGVVAGVGSVIIFIPQIAVLFFLLSLLEDSGYLCRAAFLMDKLMRPFGLQGRSFIPLLSSFACAIPGIMSTRTIPSFADRLTTIMVAPLMSCSARLPVYTVLIAAVIPSVYLGSFFSLQALVLFSMYALGIIGAALVSFALKHTFFKSEPTIFLMEMPPYRLPSLKLAVQASIERVWIFLKSAGSIILACSIVLWFLASFPQGHISQSFAGKIGHAIEPIIQPLGYDWQIGIALLSSFAAREVFVSSLSTVYNLESDDSGFHSLISLLQERSQAGHFSTATALSLMVFYVFACQCLSTLAVCKRETGGWRWPIFMFVYMTVLAYLAAFVTFRIFS